MAKKRWLAVLAVVASAGAAYAFTRTPKKDPALTDEALQHKVTRKTVVVEVVDTGRIEPRRKVDVKSKVSGQVLDVMVEHGQSVDAGHLLLVLEPTDYQRDVARAEASLARAQNALNYAQLELKRKRRALSRRGVAEIEVELAQNDARAKALAVTSARIELSAAQDRLRYTKIEAPIAGTVLELNIKKGEVVTPGVQQTFEGRPLLTIGDLSQLIVRCELNQIDIARVKKGQIAKLTFDAIPDRTFEAKVTMIAPAAVKAKNQEVEMFPVEATLITTEPKIKAGMTADVRFTVDEHPDVLAVPIEAVVKDKDNKAFVYTIVDGDEGSKKQKIAVELGPRSDREQVITDGLKAGDRILVDPASAEDNEVEL
ncbi:MAG: efflux RND transporter periplasmic adaptor subunit [Myxococcota bacterium]